MATKKKPSPVVAQKTNRPARKSPAESLEPVEFIARRLGINAWELASLKQAKGWKEGKRVAEADFQVALEALRNRRQGGGKL